MRGVSRPRDVGVRRGRIVALALLAFAFSGRPAGATNCYTQIDPYYWTFDVPAMIHVNTPAEAAQVRRSVVDYLWNRRGYPAYVPDATHLACDGDPAPARGPFPPSFPQGIPGLALWLDARDAATISRSGTSVSGWADKSGVGNDAAQNATSSRPTYDAAGLNGSPAIRFDGVDDFLEALDANSLDIANPTLFVVIRFATPNAAEYALPIAKMPVNAAYVMAVDGNRAPVARIATPELQATGDGAPVGAASEVWSLVHDGKTLRMYRDGWQSQKAPVATGPTANSSGPLRIGGQETPDNHPFNGWIAEVILYDRALSDGERSQIETYLGWKHGIWRPWPPWISQIGGPIDCVDRLDIALEYGLRSVSYLLKPRNPSGRVVLFHQGHSDFLLTSGGQETMRRMIDRGHVVQTFWMPLMGENSKTADGAPGVGTYTFANHDQMATVLEDAGGSFIRFFLEPIAAALNYDEAFLAPADIAMVGVSGGGWATNLIAALDTRVSLSFPVAGSLPLYLRSGPCPNGSEGDAEQFWAPLYQSRATWLDLYALGGYGPGRKQLQVFNQYDPCCFWGVNYQTYEPHVANAVAGLGTGSYGVYLDSIERAHRISMNVLNTVIDPEITAHPVPYVPRTDLSVSQYLADDPVFTAGPALNFEVLVQNEGPSKADGATLTVIPPQGSGLVSASPSQGSCLQTVPVTCSLGTIVEGGSATVSVLLTAGPGLATNVATVAYALPDFRPQNNTSSLTAGVAAPGDMDGDAVPDTTDCASRDWTAFAVPAEVAGLAVGSGGGNRETISWSSAVPAAGVGTTHDVLRGGLAALRIGNGLAATCLATGLAVGSFADPTIPAAGQGFWYLARGVNACGSGTLGFRSGGIERTAGACP